MRFIWICLGLFFRCLMFWGCFIFLSRGNFLFHFSFLWLYTDIIPRTSIVLYLLINLGKRKTPKILGVFTILGKHLFIQFVTYSRYRCRTFTDNTIKISITKFNSITNGICKCQSITISMGFNRKSI